MNQTGGPSPKFKPPPPHVVIVGGGLAGLAAAVGLVDRGLRITLLESRPRLGGRASSFNDPLTGELVDNCQHVSMVCCTNLADFCARVGLSGLFQRVSEVVFLSPEGKLSRLKAGWFPAPLHLAGSFLRANYLTWPEKIRVALALSSLCRRVDERPGESCDAWLRRHWQTPRAIDRYWSSVLVSALNERLDQMDVGHARKVFLDGFLRDRESYQMELPLAPLGELYGQRLNEWLDRKRVMVRMATGARSLRVDEEGTVSGLSLRSGEEISADFVILAVPFDRLASLIPAGTAERLPALEQAARLQASPITGAHFWFDRVVCPYEHVVTLGKSVQWVFNHTAMQGRRPQDAEGGQYLQLVVSASYDLLKLDKEAIRDRMLSELSELWPATKDAKLLRWWVVTEHGATFAVRPGVDACRPSQRTPVDGLFLAGDWTMTGWPATMEGAVKSGYMAAEALLRDLGRPARLVQAERPPAWLSRLLFRFPSSTASPPAFQISKRLRPKP